jgi:hypothetical protein
MFTRNLRREENEEEKKQIKPSAIAVAATIEILTDTQQLELFAVWIVHYSVHENHTDTCIRGKQ